MPKKIIFVKMSSFSHTNESLLSGLEKEFLDNQIIVVDIWQDLVKKKSALNILTAFYEYGLKIAFSRRLFSIALMRNSYIFQKVKKEINKKFNKENILFTFQTQSLFDTSIVGIANYVYTDHTFLVNKKYPSFNKNKVFFNERWIKCEKSIYNNARINLTMSTHITNSIIEDYDCPAEKVKCVYAGSNVKSKNISQLSSKRFRTKNILFVGVKWKRKGGPSLEKAFRKVLEKHPDATLTIVGCSPELNLKNCNIVGKVPLEEVEQYYKKASIFCLPTTLEPFGIVFLEAMSYKLPIVATNIGAIPDFIIDGKNGYMVEPKDIDSLSEKLINLLESPEKCESFGKYGFEKILDKYTWENVATNIKKQIDGSLI